jgi:hypothetical protein
MKDSVKITIPVFIISTNGKLLSQSNFENKTFTIELLNVSQIDTIKLVLGSTSIGTFVIGILTKIPQFIAAFKPGNTSDNLMCYLSSFTTLQKKVASRE